MHFWVQVNIWMFLDKIRKEFPSALRYNEGYKNQVTGEGKQWEGRRMDYHGRKKSLMVWETAEQTSRWRSAPHF